MSYEAKPIFFYNPSQSTEQIKSGMQSFLKEWLAKHSLSSEIIIYHYTTLEGLKGILRNRSIWFTNTSTLNDPLEIKYGKQLVLKILNEKIKAQEDDNVIKLLHNLANFARSFNTGDQQTYVACFCKSENLLSQWRGYAAKGGGYNLGIRINNNTKFYHMLDDFSDDSYVCLRKMIYNPEEQEKLISDYMAIIIESANTALKEFKENGRIPDAWETIAAMEAVNILFDLMLSFKDPVFQEENEWRLIKGRIAKHRPEQLNFREQNETLIPYLITYITEKREENLYFPLDSIKIGPMMDSEKTLSPLSLYINNQASLKNKININSNDVKINSAGYVLRQ